jgi:hypothetical protein
VTGELRKHRQVIRTTKRRRIFERMVCCRISLPSTARWRREWIRTDRLPVDNDQCFRACLPGKPVFVPAEVFKRSGEDFDIVGERRLATATKPNPEPANQNRSENDASRCPM